jgi:heme exporter protein C
VMYGKGLRGLALATAAIVTLTLALVFFWAPNDATEGFLQKIFYIHVPLAIVTLCGFIAGGLAAIQHLRTRDPKWDMRSYVAIHISLVFGVGVLITGSIWAKGAWGHWWVWNEPTLVSFLLVMLLYATYQPLRFAIEDPERQARAASVFAITAGVFVPINFTIVRLSTAYVHPRTLDNISGNLPGRMQVVFWLAIASVALLWLTLWRYEMTSKHANAQLRTLRRLLAGDESEQPVRRSAAPSVTHAGGGAP